MEKMIWEKPEMNVVAFAANEYVAACGDSGKVYKFVCDALEGKLYYWKRQEWQGGLFGQYVDTDWSKYDGVVDGSVDKDKVGSATLIGSYEPCGASHEVESTDDFFDGFVDYNSNQQFDSGEGVIVWRGTYGNNGHATTQLDMTKWETAKS